MERDYIITTMQMECKNYEQDLHTLTRMILDTWRIYQARINNDVFLIFL